MTSTIRQLVRFKILFGIKLLYIKVSVIILVPKANVSTEIRTRLLVPEDGSLTIILIFIAPLAALRSAFLCKVGSRKDQKKR